MSNARLKLAKKIKQKLSNTLKLNFLYLKFVSLLHPRYHLKMIGDILKNVQQGAQGLQAFAFFVVIVNDEPTQPAILVIIF